MPTVTTSGLGGKSRPDAKRAPACAGALIVCFEVGYFTPRSITLSAALVMLTSSATASDGDSAVILRK